jgi:hypothetical protein
MAGFWPGAGFMKAWLKILSIFVILLICGSCAGKKIPSAGLIRQQIEDLGLGTIEKDHLRILQVSMAQKDQAIVETNLQVSLEVFREKGKEWQIKSVRLGDRDWVDFDLFMEAVNSIRTRQTQEMLNKLAKAITLYKDEAKRTPPVNNITKLTDVLVPEFLSEVIRFDSWNREIRVEPQADGSLILRSLGADGISNTADDIIKHF